MKTFTGSRTIDGVKAWVDGKPLEPRYDLKRFTTSGFEWTYEGPEPSQLALAILAEHLDDGEMALKLTDAFMREVVANLDNDWRLTGDEIDQTLAQIGGG